MARARETSAAQSRAHPAPRDTSIQQPWSSSAWWSSQSESLNVDGNTFRIIDQLADALGTEVQPPFGPREHCHRMPRFRCTGAHRRLLHITKRGRCRYRWSPCGRHARDRRPCSALAIREQSTVWMSSGTERPIDSCARIARFGVYCLLRGPRAEIRPSSVFPNSAVGDSFASGARSALSLTPVVGRLGRNRGEWRGKSGQMLLPRQGSSACFCILTRRASEGNAPDPSLALRVGI